MLSIIFVLTMTSVAADLYGNVVFSILVLSTKERCPSFLKNVFLFQKIFSKAEVLKVFKIFIDCSTDYHIKTCRSLKRRAILRIPKTAF